MMTLDDLRAFLQGVRDRLPPELTDEQFREAGEAAAAVVSEGLTDEQGEALLATAEALLAALKAGH